MTLYNKVEICGVNTAKLEVLSNDEKASSGRNQKGGHEGEGNLYKRKPLVLSVIQRFTNRGENMDDLFQVGCIGLIKAIDNFDTSHDVKFSPMQSP